MTTSPPPAGRDDPLYLRARQSVLFRRDPGIATLQRSLRISAGTAHVQGPAPGAVTVSWQPARWAAAGPKGPAQWQSQGAISKVPLAWLEVLR